MLITCVLAANTPRMRGAKQKASTPALVKRAKKNPKEEAEQSNHKTSMDSIWETIRKSTDEEGRQYSVLFFRLPSKKEYLVIKAVMCIGVRNR